MGFMFPGRSLPIQGGHCTFEESDIFIAELKDVCQYPNRFEKVYKFYSRC